MHPTPVCPCIAESDVERDDYARCQTCNVPQIMAGIDCPKIKKADAPKD